MKRTYINPINKVIVLDVVSLLAESPTPGIQGRDATQGGGSNDSEVNGDGDGFARGASLWHEEW